MYLAALNGEETAVELDSLGGASRFTVEVGPLRDERGDAIGGVAIARDVTAVRQLEAEVRLRERVLDAAFEASPVGVVRATVEGRYIEVNDAFAEMLGYSRSDLAGMTFREVTHPEDIDADEQGRVAFITAGGRRQHRGEKRYVRADGEVVWGLVSATLIEASGHPPEFHIQVIDITERKRLEERFRGLLESAPDAIVVVDDQGVIALVNAQTERMFGYDRDELLGQRVRCSYRMALDAATRLIDRTMRLIRIPVGWGLVWSCAGGARTAPSSRLRPR
jgi:PAS domain S-box-containing protein